MLLLLLPHCFYLGLTWLGVVAPFASKSRTLDFMRRKKELNSKINTFNMQEVDKRQRCREKMRHTLRNMFHLIERPMNTGTSQPTVMQLKSPVPAGDTRRSLRGLPPHFVALPHRREASALCAASGMMCRIVEYISSWPEKRQKSSIVDHRHRTPKTKNDFAYIVQSDASTLGCMLNDFQQHFIT